MTEEFDKPVQRFDKLPYMAVILDDLGGTPAFRNGNNFLRHCWRVSPGLETR